MTIYLLLYFIYICSLPRKRTNRFIGNVLCFLSKCLCVRVCKQISKTLSFLSLSRNSHSLSLSLYITKSKPLSTILENDVFLLFPAKSLTFLQINLSGSSCESLVKKKREDTSVTSPKRCRSLSPLFFTLYWLIPTCNPYKFESFVPKKQSFWHSGFGF